MAFYCNTSNFITFFNCILISLGLLCWISLIPPSPHKLRRYFVKLNYPQKINTIHYGDFWRLHFSLLSLQLMGRKDCFFHGKCQSPYWDGQARCTDATSFAVLPTTPPQGNIIQQLNPPWHRDCSEMPSQNLC